MLDRQDVRELNGFRLTNVFGPNGNGSMAVKAKDGRSLVATGPDDEKAMAAWDAKYA